MPHSVRCRTALATGAVGLLAAVSIPAGSDSASAVDTDAHKYVELEIVNATDENLDLDAKLSSNGSQGRTASKERNGIKPLPTSTFDSGKGARQSYALDFVGDYDWKEKIGFIYDYKNFLNVQAASPSTPGKSQTTLTHEGRVYGEAESKKVAVNASAGNADPYRFTLEEQEQPASGFDKKYRLVISKDNIYDGNRSGFVPDVKRLTSSGRAVYKVTVPERTQKLASVPADLKVGPYTVFGRGFDPTSGKEIGKVLPVGKPTLDQVNKTLTLPKATFFFEYPEGYFPQYYLTVLDEAGLGGTQELSRVPGPPAGLDQSAITAISAAPATGNG
ncbi:hypothetical protein, partial [Streptomyces sp. ADI96-02]|uniref:hypothetical protein n=1 Tax=Streptomyces sp. ADI96-02 TaxID=1522760 RepID=UPI0013DE0309